MDPNLTLASAFRDLLSSDGRNTPTPRVVGQPPGIGKKSIEVEAAQPMRPHFPPTFNTVIRKEATDIDTVSPAGQSMKDFEVIEGQIP